MHILALAVDYDGTIAQNGAVTPRTVEALMRLRNTGRKLLLVTGRQMTELAHVFNALEIFDYIVAENGGVLYEPKHQRTKIAAPPPSTALIDKLAETRGIPIAVGETIIATWRPHENEAIRAIHDLGLELQIIFNKDAVMILPAGVNKASGLRLALKELDISPLSVAACGDAENDHAFLSSCGCTAAVANALPALKSLVDIVLEGDHGSGVEEFVERILAEDDAMLPVARRGIEAGVDKSGEVFHLVPENVVLLAGNSGCGKSSYITLLTERMVAKGHEFCVIDPEGDYLTLEGAVTIGGLDIPPSTENALHLLLQAGVNVVINTMALGHEARRRLFSDLMPSIRQLRETTGRPQWLLLDEAHYMLPFPKPGHPEWSLAKSGAVVATVDPDKVGEDVLREVDVVIAMGSSAPEIIAQIAAIRGLVPPASIPHLEPEEFLVWRIGKNGAAAAVKVLRRELPEQAHSRHSGKYATGDVGQQRSFYFQNIGRYAHNLREFLHIAEKAGDATWNRHLKAGDFSAWFRYVIRDDGLADEAAQIEKDTGLSAKESRKKISDAVLARYAMDQTC